MKEIETKAANAAMVELNLMALFLVLVAATSAAAATTTTTHVPSVKAHVPEKPEVENIRDNSYLIEEAYNQEPGVIQHIQNVQYLKKSQSWVYTFTEEWPVPNEKHQLSVTLPLLSNAGTSDQVKVGDIALNYRYQLVDIKHIALAPRLSVLMPTGNFEIGTSSGSIGLQTNIPLSVELSHSFVTHWNLGATFFPTAYSMAGADAQTLSFNYGASLIYLVTPTFNLMLEFAGASNETVNDDGGTDRSDSFYVNPGFRFAMNFKSGLQIVPGFAVPIGVGPSSGELGAYGYLSFEHPFF